MENRFESIIENNLTGRDLEEFNRIYYGRRDHLPLKFKESSLAAAKEANFDLAGYAFPAASEHTRPPRVVLVGIVQHSFASSTDRPINEQREAMFEKVKKIIDTPAKKA